MFWPPRTAVLRALAAVGIALALLLPGRAALASDVLDWDEEPARSIEIVIEKETQQMAVYVDGELRYAFRVSTGRRIQPTPSGRFRPLSLVRMAYAPKYDNAPMPWSIFFTPQGHAIHETGHLDTLGRPVSHGCVRLEPEAAQLLYALVQRVGLKRTTIEIY